MPNGPDARDHMRRQDPYLYAPPEPFPQSFWQHYATRHACTPRVRQFLNGWGSYKAWYGVQDLNIWIKQLLRKGGNVVVYVTGEKTEPKEPSFASLTPYQGQIEQFATHSDLCYAPPTALYAHFLLLPTTTRDHKTWDKATDFMEDILKQYQMIFDRPFTF